nr:hypothetical protein [Tanacetum cinerariifolium]
MRGLNNVPNQDQVIQLLHEDKYSFCGLLETHVKERNLPRICNRVLGNWSWASNCSSCSSGTRIIVGWDPNCVNMMVIEQTTQDKPWTILGDFNVCLDPSKRSCGSSKFTTAMANFRDYVEEIEVDDLAMTGLRFTWNKKPGREGGLLKKLDRVL